LLGCQSLGKTLLQKNSQCGNISKAVNKKGLARLKNSQIGRNTKCDLNTLVNIALLQFSSI